MVIRVVVAIDGEEKRDATAEATSMVLESLDEGTDGATGNTASVLRKGAHAFAARGAVHGVAVDTCDVLAVLVRAALVDALDGCDERVDAAPVRVAVSAAATVDAES